MMIMMAIAVIRAASMVRRFVSCTLIFFDHVHNGHCLQLKGLTNAFQRIIFVGFCRDWIGGIPGFTGFSTGIGCPRDALLYIRETEIKRWGERQKFFNLVFTGLYIRFIFLPGPCMLYPCGAVAIPNFGNWYHIKRERI